MIIPIKRLENYPKKQLPTFAKPGDAGVDLYAAIDEPINLPLGSRVLIPTGISVELPAGRQFEVRPRSGMALKEGVTVLNTPGTIDAGYRAEIGVILFYASRHRIYPNQPKTLKNGFSYEVFTVNPGERIAQLVLMPAYHFEWKEVDKLSETERASGGFGSTGKK